MSKEVLFTEITNLKASARTVHWAAKGALWLGANAVVEVPYDVWTQASPAQRKSIVAETKSGLITLTINALQADGTYRSVDLVPHGEVAAGAQKAPTKDSKPKDKAPTEPTTPEEMRTIVAAHGRAQQAAKHMGIASAPVKPTDGDFDPSEALGKEGFHKTAVLPTVEPVEEPVVEPVEEPVVEPVEEPVVEPKKKPKKTPKKTPKEEPVKELSIEEVFAKHVEARQWDEALQLLIDTYGEDKVTFTTRTIMSMKDFDAIAQKYELN